MARYHFNKETGRANICRAEKQCPLGSDTPHFDNKEDAKNYIEADAAKNNSMVATISKKNNKENKITPENFNISTYKPNLKYTASIVSGPEGTMVMKGAPEHVAREFYPEDGHKIVRGNSASVVKTLNNNVEKELNSLYNYKEALKKDPSLKPALASLQVSYGVGNLNDYYSHGDNYNYEIQQEQLNGLISTGLLNENNRDKAFDVLNKASIKYDTGETRTSSGLYADERNIQIAKALKKAKLLNI